jgi:hypothetical protein
MLSIPEFRAITGEAMAGLHAWLKEGRTQFLSTSEAAREVLNSLDDTMRQWSWCPRIFIHPTYILLRALMIAAMRFPLYVGKETLAYYLKEFWNSRWAADLFQSVDAHYQATADVGAVQAITAAVKQAALGLMPFVVSQQGEPIHPLGEIVKQVVEEYPGRVFQYRNSLYGNPATAWRYLEFRCGLSGVSLDWCRKLALDVVPQPSAFSLFENAEALEARVIEILNSPFVSARR